MEGCGVLCGAVTVMGRVLAENWRKTGRLSLGASVTRDYAHSVASGVEDGREIHPTGHSARLDCRLSPLLQVSESPNLSANLNATGTRYITRISRHPCVLGSAEDVFAELVRVLWFTTSLHKDLMDQWGDLSAMACPEYTSTERGETTHGTIEK